MEAYPGGGQRRQVGTESGNRPAWHADSGELYYLANGGDLMSITVDPSEDQPFGKPRRLFSLRPPSRSGERDFAVSPDGERFLFLQEPQARALAPTTVAVNWDEELRGP